MNQPLRRGCGLTSSVTILDRLILFRPARRKGSDVKPRCRGTPALFSTYSSLTNLGGLMWIRFSSRIGAALLFFVALPLLAQNQQDLSGTLLHEDSAFWDAYNRCDVEKMSQFFWP